MPSTSARPDGRHRCHQHRHDRRHQRALAAEWGDGHLRHDRRVRGHPLHPAHEPQAPLLAEVDQAEAAGRAAQLPRRGGAARFPRPGAHPADRRGAGGSRRARSRRGWRTIPRADVAIAVCLLFSYVNPAHELRLREFLHERFPDVPVSLSHEVAPIWREYERGSTVIADSYVKPIMQRYIEDAFAAFTQAGLDVALVADEVERRARRRPTPRRRSRSSSCSRDWPAASSPGSTSGSSRARAISSRSTWAAPPATSGWSATARSPTRPTSRSSSGCRWRRRRSISPPSAPAAARSPGSTRAVCCASGRRAPGPIPGRSATTRVARR